MRSSILLLLLPGMFFIASPLPAQNPLASEARLLRFPAIHGDQVVFTYAGDLYTVASTGGVARKLTTDVGYEMFPRFSPDGSSIAFTGQYDGNTEVYLMSAEGGVPRRLTYTATLGRDDVSDRMGPNNIVMGWRDDKSVIFRSRRIDWNDFRGHLFLASTEGGLPEELPLPRGGFCSYSPDRKQLAYNRVFREFRTWKRYRGGQADDIWIYDFASKTTVNITGNPAQDIIPMWVGNRIYFLSDRDEHKRLNLYSVDPQTREVTKHTDFTEYDCKFPSAGGNAIVFENGGWLYRFDIATNTTAKIPVRILDDFDAGRGGLVDVSKSVTNYEISHDGKRALFGARGEIFTVPAKYGPTRNITNSSGAHERSGKWSPDGKWIAYIGDASGEDEIYIQAPGENAAPVKLTEKGDTYKYDLLWSPDSKYLLWGDKKQRLQYVDVGTREVTLVAQAVWEITSFAWSPDSKWIAFARPEEKTMTTIQLYSLVKKETSPVTDGWYSSYAPQFSADGKYLFFVSNRSFSPMYGQTEFNYAYFDMAKIYFVTLAKDTKSPFEPKSDEVGAAEEKKGEEKKKEGEGDKDKGKDGKPPEVRVDPEGLPSRIVDLPGPAGSYRDLASAGNKLFYMRSALREPRSRLYVYDFESLKETELGEIGGYEISADRKKMLVGKDGSYAIIDLPNAKIEMKETLNLSDMKMQLDRRSEWTQIFNECWRQMRDFFYAPNMNGVDWPAVRASYAKLLPYVNHRADLTYVIGEMISELNSGHSYVGGGDLPSVSRIDLGLLGAVLERDSASGYYRIAKILSGRNWDKSLRSPLTEIGVNAREGDYILAVNGKPTDRMRDIYESLVNTAGKQVHLRLATDRSGKGSREATVIPIADEAPLYYYNWVENNRRTVDTATGGRVGYIHVPDMGPGGLNEFVRAYYPQLRKEALIIDVRGNGGGNVSPMIAERLRRQIAMIDIARNGVPSIDPGGTILGPKVCLLDEFSASDGDIFPYRFRQYKLGKLIGKRSWGGVVGIRGSLPIVDGGYLNRPEFSRYDLEGKEWIMEGHGVEPDIVVDNDPAKEFGGEDEQLENAIRVILEEMKTHPATLAPPPPYPDKTK